MFKLLPEKSRKDIGREYKYRRGLLMLLGLCFVVGVGIISLIPSFVVAFTTERSAVKKLEVAKKLPLLEGVEDVDEWLKGLKEKQKILKPTSKSDFPYEYFIKIIDLKPQGISIKNLSWRRDQKGRVITIMGNASSRNTLIEFEKTLDNSGSFSNAVLPVSNFARDKDIEFTLTVSPK